VQFKERDEIMLLKVLYWILQYDVEYRQQRAENYWYVFVYAELMGQWTSSIRDWVVGEPRRPPPKTASSYANDPTFDRMAFTSYCLLTQLKLPQTKLYCCRNSAQLTKIQ